MTAVSYRRWMVLLLWPTLIALAGCGKRDEIARYTVPKPELIDPTLVSATSSAEGAAQQTLGAIVVVGDMGWFFKLKGDPQAVEPEKERFLTLVKSLKFSQGAEPKPAWSLPEGWKELPGSGMRYATIQIASSDKPLELTVIPLPLNPPPKTADDKRKVVLDNINRWRGEVGLAPIGVGSIGETSEAFSIGDYEAWFVTLTGVGKGGMSAPFAPFAGGAPAGGATPRADGEKRASGSDLEYDAPAEWKARTPNQFSLAAFSVAEGDRKLTITISSAGGDLLTNVNRWRGQVQLGPTTAAELAASAKKIPTLGGEGDYVELVGPPESSPRQTILGVIAPAGGRTWFIKLIGDHELAEREKPRFEQFVKSVRLRSK